MLGILIDFLRDIYLKIINSDSPIDICSGCTRSDYKFKFSEQNTFPTDRFTRPQMKRIALTLALVNSSVEAIKLQTHSRSMSVSTALSQLQTEALAELKTEFGLDDITEAVDDVVEEAEEAVEAAKRATRRPISENTLPK